MDDLHKVLEQLKRVEKSTAWNHDGVVDLREQVYFFYLCLLHACNMQRLLHHYFSILVYISCSFIPAFIQHNLHVHPLFMINFHKALFTPTVIKGEGTVSLRIFVLSGIVQNPENEFVWVD